MSVQRHEQQNEQQSRLLKIDEVASRLGVSVATVRRGKNIPKPVTIGARLKRWRESEIDALLGGEG